MLSVEFRLSHCGTYLDSTKQPLDDWRIFRVARELSFVNNKNEYPLSEARYKGSNAGFIKLLNSPSILHVGG